MASEKRSSIFAMPKTSFHAPDRLRVPFDSRTETLRFNAASSRSIVFVDIGLHVWHRAAAWQVARLPHSPSAVHFPICARINCWRSSIGCWLMPTKPWCVFSRSKIMTMTTVMSSGRNAPVKAERTP